MFQMLRKPVPDRDRVVIFSENGTADIAAVIDVDENAVYADSADQEYAIPITDLKSFVGPSGRIYLLAADQDYIRDTQRLAALERSTVLRQVTQFTKPAAEATGGIKIKEILLYILIGVLVVAVIFK
jgi:hypothetical protein